MTAAGIWHGTETEGADLVEAVKHNCTCLPQGFQHAPGCGVHQLLADQHTLDRLLFARRIAAKLRREEFEVEDSSVTPA